MGGIGTRQRHHHPGGRPRRQLARTYRRQRRIGQTRQQLQPPADPADVSPAPASQLVLRQALALHQLAQQQRLLNAGERAILRARQHPQHCLGQAARPLLDGGRVATEPAQRGDAPIAVDQHPWVRTGTAGRCRHDAGYDLAAPLDGLGDPRHRLRVHQAAGGEAQVQLVQVKLQAMAVHGRHRRRGGPLAPVTSRRILVATSVGFTMGHSAPSGRGQHGRDGDRDGAGTQSEAVADRDDRTNGSASSLAAAARPEMRRRARSPSRRPPADHPPATGVNHDASLFFCAPACGPSGRHASPGHDGSSDSVCLPSGASGDAPVRHSHCRSRSARGRSGGTRPPRSNTARTGTDGQPPARPARHHRRSVDERRPRQDTRPAFVPVTVWGTASRQNCQVEFGAVLALKSGRLPAACRGARYLGIPSDNPATTVSGLEPVSRRGSQDARRAAARATIPPRAPHRIASGRDSRRQ